jgi:hypothetical protein
VETKICFSKVFSFLLHSISIELRTAWTSITISALALFVRKKYSDPISGRIKIRRSRSLTILKSTLRQRLNRRNRSRWWEMWGSRMNFLGIEYRKWRRKARMYNARRLILWISRDKGRWLWVQVKKRKNIYEYSWLINNNNNNLMSDSFD